MGRNRVDDVSVRTNRFVVATLAAVMFAASAYAQDDCATAVSATCNGTVTLDPASDTTPTGPLNGGLSPCASTGTNDVWATFVATDASARLRTDAGGSVGTDSEFVVYSVIPGDICNSDGWVEIGCSADDSAVPFLGDISIEGLVVGDTYLVQMGHWNDAYTGSFVLDIECPAAGDFCGDGVISTIPGAEECDGAATGNCPGTCEADCTCTLCLPAGEDPWITKCDETTFVDIGTPPIAAIPGGYFFPGSPPFSGRVGLGGSGVLPTDTIISRLAPLCFSNQLPSAAAIIPIEIVQLDLVSCDCIDVGGARFEMDVTLIPGGPSMGDMTATKENADGGTFTSNLNVNVALTFVPCGGGPAVGPPILSAVGLSTSTPGSWLQSGPGGANFQAGFVIDPNTGQQCCEPVCHGNPGGRHPHCVQPVDCQKCPVGPKVKPDPHITLQGTSATFGSADVPAIPADFFGPGSDPLASTVNLLGGPTDTLGQRSGPIVCPGTGLCNPVSVELIALDLVSTVPITVTFNGGQNPEAWDVAVALSPTAPQSLGTLDATLTQPNGGRYDADIPFSPRFTFTELGTPSNVLVLDYDLEGLAPIRINFGGTDWVVQLGPGLVGTIDAPNDGNFVAGVREIIPGDPNTQIVVQSLGLSKGGGIDHPVQPPPIEPPKPDPHQTVQPTSVQFGSNDVPAIPADFFEAGTAPFTGVVDFGEAGTSTWSTVIQRSREVPPLNDGETATIDVEIVALSLVSQEPITVSSSFGFTSEWDVEVELSSTPAPLGQMHVTKTHANGGVFSAEFFVQPMFTFRLVFDPLAVVTLDYGQAGLKPIAINLVDVPWVRNLPPELQGLVDAPNDGNFVPGIEHQDIGAPRVVDAAGLSKGGGVTHTVRPPPGGACCLADGSCQDIGATECQALGGSSQSENSVCQGTGACCLDIDDGPAPYDTCRQMDALCCTSQGGTFHGVGSTCALEACCLPNGTCTRLDPACCLDSDGTPLGPNSTCAGVEACVFPDQTCQNLDVACCVNEGGLPFAGEVCRGVAACCMPGDICENLDVLVCSLKGGSPQDPQAKTLYSISSRDNLLRTIDPWDASTLSSVPISISAVPGVVGCVSGGTGLAAHPVTGELWALLKDVTAGDCGEDPTRTEFAGCPGSAGCHQFSGDQASCESAWLIGEEGPASCYYTAGTDECRGCGTRNEEGLACVNTCAPSCLGDPSRTIYAGGAGTAACTQFDGDQASCEAAYQVGGTGVTACFFNGASGACRGCGPNNEGNGLCVNTCAVAPPPCPDDPTRTIFAGGPGTQACRQFTGDQVSCETAYALSFDGVVSCFFEPDTGDCMGCGPGNDGSDVCTNTCAPSPECLGAKPPRTIYAGGPFTQACRQFTGDQTSCESAFAKSVYGIVSCFFEPLSGECKGCAPPNEDSGFCVNACEPPPCDLDKTRTIFAGGPETQACRQFTDDPKSCESAYHLGGSGIASCFFDALTGECKGCGPTNSEMGVCVNTCEPPVCLHDPIRTIFAGDPIIEGCRLFDGDESSCDLAFQASGSGPRESCFFIKDLCLGCQSKDEDGGLCDNSCAPPPGPPCTGDPARTIFGGGSNTGACHRFSGDEALCESAYIVGDAGVASCFFDSTSGECRGCGPPNECRGLCVNTCGSLPLEDGRDLAIIDPTTGVATIVGNTGDRFAGLVFDSGGTLFGVTGDGGCLPDSLFTLSQVDGSATFQCSLGNGTDGEALGYNPDDGHLYHASGHSGAGGVVFERIDSTTGDSCRLTDIDISTGALIDEEAQALTYWNALGEFLWKQNHGPGPLFTVTPGGVETYVGEMDHQAKGLAFAPSACEPLEACCFSDGSCQDVAPTCCLKSGGYPNGSGTFCEGDGDGDGADDGCTCTVLPDGSGCTSAFCPTGPGASRASILDQCEPRCVTYDTITGETIATQCDCIGYGTCHVEMPGSIGGAAGGGPPGSARCTAQDNGTGTITLPPEYCEYLSPDEVHEIVDGLPPGTTLELAAIHRDFICGQKSGGSVCSVLMGPNECETEGGSLGGNVDCFDSSLELRVSFGGDFGGFNRTLWLPVSTEVHTGPRNPGDPVQDFDTEMFRLQGELFGDPDFCTFRITGGTDNGLPSPGHTTLVQLPSGDFAVDSFFDITYQITFQGCPGSLLEGMGGSTTGTIRMQTGDTPRCVGDCPPGTVCVERRMVNADGTVDLCCDCSPTCPVVRGDLDGDGDVDLHDAALFMNCFTGTDAGPFALGCECADLDTDGDVDLDDWAILAGQMSGP